MLLSDHTEQHISLVCDVNSNTICGSALKDDADSI